MPFTHVDIQKERQWKSIFLFIILVVYYFLSFIILASVVRLLMYWDIHDATAINPFLSLKEIGVCSSVAFVLAIGHWIYAINDGIPRIIKSLRGQPPDLTDRYHIQFQNVIDEIQIACGGKKVRGVIVPTLATNSFALATREDNAVIGVTEGLLARLNRSQLETVIAQEMAHIINNDCILTTMACCLFGTFAQLLQISISGAENTRRGTPWIFVGVLWILTKGAQILNVAISRQREYLADATAVKLTRNPISLAESMLIISNTWRGFGYLDSSMAPIFIMNPEESLLDQKETLWADLFATHPPIKKRIQVLMDLAHTDIQTLSKNVIQQETMHEEAKESSESNVPILESTWWLRDNLNWAGPLTGTQLLAMNAFSPNSWVCREKGENVMIASDDSELCALLSSKLSSTQNSSYTCPRCHQPFHRVFYEGLQVDQCPYCRGYLIHEENIFKILARREIGFSDDFKKRVTQNQLYSQTSYIHNTLPSKIDSSSPMRCPKCNLTMLRGFYSYQYYVIVDRCYTCKNIWFDKDELAMLQVMVEESSVG